MSPCSGRLGREITRRRWRREIGDREGHRKLGAAASAVFRRQLPSVHAHDRAADRKAEPESVGLRCKEGLIQSTERQNGLKEQEPCLVVTIRIPAHPSTNTPEANGDSDRETTTCRGIWRPVGWRRTSRSLGPPKLRWVGRPPRANLFAPGLGPDVCYRSLLSRRVNVDASTSRVR